MSRTNASKKRAAVPAVYGLLDAMPARLDPHTQPDFVQAEARFGWPGYGATAPTGELIAPSIDVIVRTGDFVPFDIPPTVSRANITRIESVDWNSEGPCCGDGLVRLPSRARLTRGVRLPVMSAFFDLRWLKLTPGELVDVLVWAMKNDADPARGEEELRRLRFAPPTNGDTNHTFVNDGSTTYLIRHNRCDERLMTRFETSRRLFGHLAKLAYAYANDLRSRVLLLRALIASQDLVLCRYWVADAK